MTVAELIPVLQAAIGPVVLISGVGLLILSLTNRMGRVIDRGRSLAAELRQTPESKHPGIREQLESLSGRSRLLQRAIVYAVLCVLFAAVLIITIFFTASLGIETAWILGSLFVISLLFLIMSLVSFLRELNQALTAFRLDIGKKH